MNEEFDELVLRLYWRVLWAAKAEDLAPDLKREQKMIERNELAVNLAPKDFYPDDTVSGGYFNQGRMAPMYQFRIDIPLRLYSERKQRLADLLLGELRELE